MGSNAGGRRREGGAAPPAYQQVADRLRARILSGELPPGRRLAGEGELGDEHGVSRSTVREAIRLLEAQRLVVTTRGTTGGSFVARHGPDRIGSELEASLDLLVAHDTLTVEQIIEARRVLEVPAAALAAARRSAEHLEQLRACVADGRDANERFHLVLLAAAGNPLLEEITAPLFGVIRDRVRRDRADAGFWHRVHDDHDVLIERIAARDGPGAAEAMGHHLDHLATGYRLLTPGDDEHGDEPAA